MLRKALLVGCGSTLTLGAVTLVFRPDLRCVSLIVALPLVAACRARTLALPRFVTFGGNRLLACCGAGAKLRLLHKAVGELCAPCGRLRSWQWTTNGRFEAWNAACPSIGPCGRL